MKRLASTIPEIAAARFRDNSPSRPKLAIVHGTGFHHVLDELIVEKKISCAKNRGFPVPTVAGHARELYFGRLGETSVLVLSGRELATRIHQTHPGLPVIAASCCVLPEEQEGSAGYLQKPFTGTGQLRKVKSALTARHAS